jgi:hypothetical protein
MFPLKIDGVGEGVERVVGEGGTARLLGLDTIAILINRPRPYRQDSRQISELLYFEQNQEMVILSECCFFESCRNIFTRQGALLALFVRFVRSC